DAEPNGLPLMLPYEYSQKIERIKITSQINDYFHLSKVNVLSAKESQNIDTVNIFYKSLSEIKIIDFKQKDKGLMELSNVFGSVAAQNISNEFCRLQNGNVVKEFTNCINTYECIRLNLFGDDEFSSCNKSFSVKISNFLYFHNSKVPFFVIQSQTIADAFYFPTIGIYYGMAFGLELIILQNLIEVLSSSKEVTDYLFSSAKSTFLGWIVHHGLPYHYFYDVMPMVHISLKDEEACKHPILSIHNEAYLKLDDFYDCKFQILQRESPLLYFENSFFIRLLKNNFSNIQNKHDNVYEYITSFVDSGKLKYEHNYKITKPVIWIGIIAGKRTWVEQVIGYALIIRKILKSYKNAFFIFDGMTTGEGAYKKSYKEHQEIINEILSKVSHSVNYLSLNGAYASEKLYFASMVDFFITDGATSSMYVAKFFKKHGVAFFYDNKKLIRHTHYNTIFYPQDFVHPLDGNKRWDFVSYSIEPKKFARFVLDKLALTLKAPNP
ncbi:MAG: hypothetical protein LBG21_03115, partial [Campylobacteraceae bacterium]|nr:hypothetical protein [Campylobacteraceae bacterium]